MAAGSARLLLNAVDVAHGDRNALACVHLALAAPGVTMVAGPSGAGKSPRRRRCNRLEVPSRGRVCLDGTDLAELDPMQLRRRVGLVLQQHPVFDGTVRDNLRVARPDADDQLFRSSLEQLGLGASFLDRDARSLSGGEAQRVCVARTLLTDPEVVLLDEPTASLDVDSTLVLERAGRRLAQEGRPVVWVTHDLEQAERLGDRVVVLIGGRVQSGDVVRRCLASRSFEGVAGGDG